MRQEGTNELCGCCDRRNSDVLYENPFGLPIQVEVLEETVGNLMEMLDFV